MRKNAYARNNTLSLPMKSAIIVAFLGTVISVLPMLTVAVVVLGGVFALIANHWIHADFVTLWLAMIVFEAITAFAVTFIIVFKNK
ncbi:MAG: hypothetical protein UR60_C0019G0020 [Candidatus Moranbacteria bacterium GW2011_GWF2_34_56]|nr:MAG: hypothetical protein UR51_C0006G0020 [Candidatus Moranbacteria bacterium GW2011_GWF1_34_10]KKP64565.1 MAG: hypothetical protein UR60_C0019G0020 [Candidatus Moranbacteria bacterium GW2011_GWF2_34_56]HBI16663.1 hypothetical protein [Candidatus Moranbacteria bacterium]